MKLLRQFLIIAAVALGGEALKALIPLPIPAGVYGLVLMFVLLFTRIVRLEQVRTASAFLIEIMPVMFIPAAVGLLDTWGQVKSAIVPMATIVVVTTVFVMAVTGRVTQSVIKRDEEKRK